ncbi:metal ABC transporter ATP-binding protein [Treponema parvum]|uniref:metal ABC transporter ATP-binding protein n=1 Tax=Treponema parvum TaxID=138851 RepID=UPI001AEBABB9|nr:ATP-binding cassette domain-containing protein [Treponema parvum]QTQ16914.1 ATP-binding cassette domain-containing protein [Treponema parvum]
MDPNSDFPVEIEVSGVSAAYNNGHVALYDASFKLNAGTITALVGVNGSGKSTLFKTIMGFIKPVKGFVKVCGMPVNKAHKQNLIAYVPQSEEVDWSFPVSVWDVVMMGRYGRMNLFRIPGKDDKEIAARSLERVQMSDFKDRQIGELSGGQKKRIFLARALAQQGKIILLDEPFTGVDLKTETAIIELLRELRDDGHLILVSTHDLGSVPEFCDRVVIINRTVLASGPTETTFTADNLIEAFGGALRSVRFDHTDDPKESRHEFRVLTDDEGALILKNGGDPDLSGIRNTDVLQRTNDK